MGSFPAVPCEGGLCRPGSGFESCLCTRCVALSTLLKLEECDWGCHLPGQTKT